MARRQLDRLDEFKKLCDLAKRKVGAAAILKITLMESCKLTVETVNGSIKSVTAESVRSPEKETPKMEEIWRLTQIDDL